jgi:ribokinase
VDSFVRPGETTSSIEFEMHPGGKGLNQSIAVARAGSEIYHAGKTGRDGQLLLDILNENKVNTNYISQKGSNSGHAIIQVNKYGNNCILLHGGANHEITLEDVDSTLDGFGAGDILMLQNEISNIPYIINKAFGKHMKIVLNPSPLNNIFDEVDLRKISYLILNEIEGESCTGETRPIKIIDSLLDRYPHLKVVLTLGKRGALYGDELNRIQQGAYQVNAVDTTAAGDTFLGYFISRVSMGSTTWSALRTAALASALAVTKKGASTSIPLWEDVLNFTAAMDKKKQKGREKTSY